MIKEEWDVSTGAPHQRLSNLGWCQSHLEGLLRDIQGPAPDFFDSAVLGICISAAAGTTCAESLLQLMKSSQDRNRIITCRKSGGLRDHVIQLLQTKYTFETV